MLHTLKAFLQCKNIHAVIIAVHPKKIKITQALLRRISQKKTIILVAGGKTRQESVWNGLKEIENWKHKPDIVVVHDGARPFVTPAMLSKSIREAKKHGGCIVAVPSKDTLKEEKNGYVLRTLPREKIVSVQTPQTFRYDILRKVFQWARKDTFMGTDESSLVERAGIKVKILDGSYKNIKITTQEDMLTARALLKSGGRE